MPQLFLLCIIVIANHCCHYRHQIRTLFKKNNVGIANIVLVWYLIAPAFLLPAFFFFSLSRQTSMITTAPPITFCWTNAGSIHVLSHTNWLQLVSTPYQSYPWSCEQRGGLALQLVLVSIVFFHVFVPFDPPAFVIVMKAMCLCAQSWSFKCEI